MTYISYFTALALSITFSETPPSQNNPNLSIQRKYVVVTLDHPGSSGGERVCPMFQARALSLSKKKLIACLSVCHKPTILFSQNLTFKSNNNFIYVMRRQSFFVKAYTCK